MNLSFEYIKLNQKRYEAFKVKMEKEVLPKFVEKYISLKENNLIKDV